VDVVLTFCNASAGSRSDRAAPSPPGRQETKVTNGKIVVRIWGRTGEPVQLFANGEVVGRARIGHGGWVKIVSAQIERGDTLWVTGPHGHTSHHITI
jgi:hypothetical protein